MYGFVNSALEKLIKRRFGYEKWEEIRVYANVILDEKDSFQVNHVYQDKDTYAVVAAASEILGLDQTILLEMFGEQFLLWCQESGYAKTLQLLGRSLRDFLTNLDALHDHLSIIYPQMDAPSFRCTEGDNKYEFMLHYYSERDGLENIVMGIVKSVAREYYKVEVDIQLRAKKGKTADHSVFLIREVAMYSDPMESEAEAEETKSCHSETQLVGPKTFCKAFPFHIIFDHNMHVLQVGSSLACLPLNFKSGETVLNSLFCLERPRMNLTFQNVLSHINTIFILRIIALDRMALNGDDPMRLRGQMVYLPESNCMLFLCSPRVKRLHDLEYRGLYLSDIPIHDATRGLLMMGQAAEAEFTNSVRLEELIIQMKAIQKLLENEKRRMSDLLHQMLPISVADRLMAGQVIESERYEGVTILFSDIVGFTSICSKSEPMQIVNLLNKLYSMFDQVVGKNQVYKVETIGDAYMVVGGLPERTTAHAEHVANQALDMMYYSSNVRRPDNNEQVVMRIGIHSGEVVAGIVGRRMPRYCLFGNTVNVASRCESNGVPGKIQVTEFTYNLLKDQPNFEFEYRGALEFKNVPNPVPCYFLLENTAKDDAVAIVIPDEQLQAFEFFSHAPSPPHSPSPYQIDSPTPDLCHRLSHHLAPVGMQSTLPVPDIQISNPTPTVTPCHSSPSESPKHILSPPSSPPPDDPTSPLSLFLQMQNNKQLLCPFSQAQQESGSWLSGGMMSPVCEEDGMNSTDGNFLYMNDNLQHGLLQSEKILQVSDLLMNRAEKAYDDSRNTSENSLVGMEGTREISLLCCDSDSRKTSTASHTSYSSQGSNDEELEPLRARAGSVHEKVTYFNSFVRARKSGIATMTSSSFDDTDIDSQPTTVHTKCNTLPRSNYRKLLNTISRPDRKSLDSQGSSGSGD